MNFGVSQTELRIYMACLEAIKKLEEDQNEKRKIDGLVAKLKNTLDKKTLNQLSKPHLQILHTLWEVFVLLRKTYDQMTKIEEYAAMLSGFQVMKYLSTILPQVSLTRDKLDKETVLNKCYVFLTSNLKKEVPAVSTKFIIQWSKKGRERVKEDQQRLAKKKREEEMEQAQKRKMQPTIPTTHYQKQKPAPKQSSEDEDESSQEKEVAQKKNQQERPKQNRESSEQRARDIERLKMQRDEERRKDDERKMKQKNQKQADAREQYRISRGRINAIEKYIDTRRDLAFQKNKNKQVTQFLATKLDQFLKQTLEQLYNIACLKNKKNPKFGNQLGYYAQQNGRVQYSNQFYFQPNTKIYSLSYKHKHEIYSLLRMKQVKKEDELRNALQAKTNQGEKKIEKRIENYILKPRPKEIQAFLIPYRDEKEYSRGQFNPAVSISLQHFVYFLQNHTWLKNSLLLFNVYHRF